MAMERVKQPDEIKAISSLDAESFFKRSNITPPASNTKITYIGVTKLGEIEQLVAFAFPSDTKVKKDFTTQIISCDLLPGSPDRLSEVVAYFIKVYNSTDIYYESKDTALGLESIGFTKTGSGYHWVNHNLTLYCYKITATDSTKYYYGVSHVKIADASIEDCEADGYYGSGGAKENNKFNSWKKRHLQSLKKTVIRTFSMRAHAYTYERSLVGDLWKTDRNCLNSCAGGRDGGLYISTETFTKSLCPIHGEVTFQGNSCKVCLSESVISMKFCKEHGKTLHQRDKCCKCVSGSAVTQLECEIHGVTKFRGLNCYQCLTSENFSLKLCKEHGLTAFIGSKCMRCRTIDSITIDNCPIHGESKFLDGYCYSCRGDKGTFTSNCEVHGSSYFQGSTCLKCRSKASFSKGFCEVHGEVNFHGDVCVKCQSEKTFKVAFCKVHGESVVSGDKCIKCKNSKSVHIDICPTHGETKFRGNKCYKCFSRPEILKECSTHGMTMFIAEDCLKCRVAKTNSFKSCPKHGLTKFAGNKCRKCSIPETVIKLCEVHGLVGHKGSACLNCRASKVAHKRFHKTPKEGCGYCEEAPGTSQ